MVQNQLPSLTKIIVAAFANFGCIVQTKPNYKKLPNNSDIGGITTIPFKDKESMCYHHDHNARGQEECLTLTGHMKAHLRSFLPLLDETEENKDI